MKRVFSLGCALRSCARKVAWWTADASIEAARLYRQLNNVGKAAALYLQVAQSGPDLMAGGALRERVGMLAQQGEQESVQNWLEQLWRQRGAAAESKYVFVATKLGRLCYQKGQWSAARDYYQQAVALSEQLRSVKERASIATDVAEATAALRLIDHWKKQWIVCDPAKISIVAGRDKKVEPVTRRLLVSVPRDVPIVVRSSDHRIKVLVIEESPWAGDAQPLRFEKQVVLEIAPEALQQDWEATLSVSSPQALGFETRVSLSVNHLQP